LISNREPQNCYNPENKLLKKTSQTVVATMESTISNFAEEEQSREVK